MKLLRSVLLRLPLGLLPLLPVLIYQASYMNSFFPITEGWFSTYGTMIRDGMVPYRDFPLLLPPLYPLFIALVQSLLGEQLIVLHGIGLLVTGLIGVVLYDILRGGFPAGVAGVSAAVALVYYQSGNAFIGYDFTQLLTLWLLLAVMMLSRYLREEGWRTRDPQAAQRLLWSGFFLALAVLTKQSNGGVGTVIIGIAMLVLLWRLAGLRYALAAACRMAAGFFIPWIAIMGWLGWHGAIAAYLRQVFTDAAAAKGGLAVSLTQWVPGFFSGAYWPLSLQLGKIVAFGMALTVLMVVLVAAIARRKSWRIASLWCTGPRASQGLAVGAAVLLLGLVALVRFGDLSPYAPLLREGEWIYRHAILAAVNLYLVGGALAMLFFLWRPGKTMAWFVLMLAVGLGLTCGNGTSAGLSEISAFLGVALLSAMALRVGLPYMVPALIPLGAMLLLAAYLIHHKYENPYYWWSIESPDIRRTACGEPSGLLAGLCVPPQKLIAMEAITEAITQHSAAGAPIYVFPHMPIFYRLADRPPFAGAVASWFDFMSDRQAEQLALSLAERPPAVLVVAQLPELVFTTHERLFRGEKPASQRQILAAVAMLQRTGQIRVVEEVAQLDGLRVIVYARVAH